MSWGNAAVIALPVTGPEALERRAEVYASQGALYQQAVQSAFELPYRPRFELWFLAADAVVVTPEAPNEAG